MKKTFILVVAIVLIIGIWYSLSKKTGTKNISNIIQTSFPNSQKARDLPATSIIAQGLDTPWAIAFLPDSSMLVTERKGTVRFVTSSGELEANPIATLTQVREVGEGGLLGIVLHPEFSSNNFIYLYYTYSGSGGNTMNRVVRMIYKDKKLSGETIIVDAIPGASNHNGGRIKFGPDGYLYITTGDAQVSSRAQDANSLAGKILRVTDEGKPVSGNPFNNRTYSYGHRNAQGLAWDKDGGLFATEHGRSGILSGFDEINYIQSGKNYGWPDIQGDETRSGMETPIKNSGATTTWAPSGMAYYNGSLFFAGLRGQTLYQVQISGKNITQFKEHFKGEFGRLREVVLGPDGMLYISTSNRDGRGNPSAEDDKIIRVNPEKL